MVVQAPANISAATHGTRPVPAAAEATQPELVLLDSSLPDGDPFTLLTVLTERGPVVTMTEFRRP